MTPRLLLREEAAADARDAFQWYETRAAGLGSEFLRALRAELAAIERAPLQFDVVVGDIRRVRLRRFPYSVYYVVLPEVISAFAIMHDRRHPRLWRSRR